MGINKQLTDIARGFEIVDSFPKLKHLPIILGESDPEGCAACSVRFHPQNAYRNGTMYSSYTAASFARKFDLAARYQVNFEGAVTWAFEFEDQPYFDGFRDLATNGIGKPVLNVFRMFGLMGGRRVAVKSTGATDLETILQEGVRGAADVQALATRQERSVEVMVWHYHDDELPGADAVIDLSVLGLPAGRLHFSHYRMDSECSNSYEVWKRMGSPQNPTPEQTARLERASELQLLHSPVWQHASDGSLTLTFNLPRQGVSLLKFTW
jgi:xylan 1,4-beta-xylosidase